METPNNPEIAVVMGNPETDSTCGRLAEAYAAAARAAGKTVAMVTLAELGFDPNLGGGYDTRTGDGVDPVLRPAVQAMTAARHLVFVYPNWWGTMPALMKGFIDKAFLPGVAFSYRKGLRLPERHWRGKTARLIVTMDGPSWFYRLFQGAGGDRAMRRSVLAFVGVRRVAVTHVDSVRRLGPAALDAWAGKMRVYAARD